MHTRVTKQLGIDFPIFAFTHCRDVVAAVSNAGGLGVLGAVAHTPEQLDIDLTWIAEQTKGRPFGVDLLIPSKYAGSESGGLDRGSLRAMVPDEHREWIEEVLRRYDVPALPPEENPGDRESRGMAGLRVDP
jgi:NAD(P)H-dependent flavin oxidoreductase YrpB (nitropropane dioxygenase family)